jgi:hypothetical protein
LPNQQQFDLNDDTFDLMSLASTTNSTPSSSLLINANQNQGILNDSGNNKMQSSNGIVPRMNPLANMENQHNQIDLNKNNTNANGTGTGLLSIQSSNSLISSSVSSLSSSSSVSSSHSGSLSQDELQFNEYNSQPSQLKYHHNHHHHSHHHHHHPYLTQHHLNQQHQQGQLQHNANSSSNNNSSINQEYPSIQLSLQNLNTLKSLSDYQQKVEYLLKLTPIPSGWQKSQTDTGEIFFINHSTRSTCWDPRLKIVESYLQKHEQVLHEQHQQHNHLHGLEFNPLSPNLHHAHHSNHHQSIPMYQQQMNSRSNSTGAVSSSSCASSNSASPLFMLNSSGSAANNVILMNSNNSMASNEVMGIESSLVQQQQQQQQKLKEFPDMLETNGETNFQHQERIKTLIDIITKKKELIKSLNELNKKVRT